MKYVAQKTTESWPVRVIGHHALRPWLQASGSLTARLKAQFSQFAVMPVRQQWQSGRLDELRALGLPPRTRIWLREVCLFGDDLPRVFAHSVIAPSALFGSWRGLRSIGQRPLGEVLFNTPAVRRGQLHYRKLPKQHPLRQQVIAAGWVSPLQPLWARRSRFMLGRQTILVTEIFLPQCAV